MKKILLVLFALLVFTMPLQQTYQEVHAAILSKAASKTAQKIANEFVKDAAINKTINVIADTSKHINDPSRIVKEGHMMFCMDYTYKPGDKCAKPASIKANLTDADKSNIGKQANTEMDKLISPNGKGFSKWAKFLDWFAPIWLVSMGVGALTYALNDDVASLFDEAAYNTLTSLGLLAPVADAVNVEPLESRDITVVENLPKYENGFFQKEYSNGQYRSLFDITATGMEWEPENVLFETQFNTTGSVYGVNTYNQFVNGKALIRLSPPSNTFTLDKTLYTGTNTLTEQINDAEPVQKSLKGTSTDTYGINLPHIQLESIRSRLPYKIGEFYYTDVLMYTSTGDKISYQIKSSAMDIGTKVTQIRSYSSVGSSTTAEVIFSALPNSEPHKKIMLPIFEEAETTFTDDSSYKDEKGNVALLPPDAFTYQEETTGETVYRVPNANGDGYEFQKPDGTPVPEDNVVPNPSQEPNITPAPDGTPQYTPAPTPSNPAPEPVPLQPDPNAPPANQPPEEPPLEPFPDGAKCDAKLQFPIFSPLKEQLSTSFPFSIPWDIERAAQAAFGGISSEKPSFKMSIPIYKGENFELNITTPKFMDDWKPFTDSLLLITFDILIMFGLYRFVKGAGS